MKRSPTGGGSAAGVRNPGAPAALALVGLAPTTSGCSGPIDLPLGQLDVQLTSGSAARSFRLSNATFDISGEHTLTVSSEQAPEQPQLRATLPVGDYEVRLLEGWQLLELDAAGERAVTADLVSGNPLPFAIRRGERTHVTFGFTTTSGGSGAAGSDGELRLGISVDGEAGARVLFSEVMRNPLTLADTQGEWLELHNAGDAAFDLIGCSLRRDQQSFTFPENLVIDAGDFLALSNAAAPGFVPDAVYRGINLPNTGGLTLELACGAQILDRVLLDVADLPAVAGASVALSPSRLDAIDNDQPDFWCDGSDSYNGDLGTPGAPNRACSGG